ncbi:peptidylprolyl isomerase [Pontibacter cellulosilyticus]|uniref:peptidylprolyl isomerase n=1 Tax=Pontibacter cellulosilyticus TaxID=1720253 RepID=A0A923N777_9BACT|nr:peptidylprolyl isomerase [Pontibacter cellulosilyticus]MBC5993501.1 peptidylprolyl isomerase [Pontibacter cellulosilyticus]
MNKNILIKQVSAALLAAGSLLFTAACTQDKTEAADTEVEEADKGLAISKSTSETIVDDLTKYGEQHQDSIAVISTRHGDIKVRLYKDVPLHRANFVRLTKAGFYDQGEFYRVVKGFAVQGGDSDNRTMKMGNYKVPQEYNPKYIHKKGALAMARYGDERNPDKESSSHNFYIVLGEPRDAGQLAGYEQQHNMKYTPEQKEIYKTIGGEPGLDSEYTVFGEVIEGMDVVEKIAEEPVDSQDWPRQVVKHTVKMTNK